MSRTHARKPVQPQGRHVAPLMMCGIRGEKHLQAAYASHVTCRTCRMAMVKQARTLRGGK